MHKPTLSHQLRIALSFLLLTVWFGLASAVYACSCAFPDQRPHFIERDHLPSNAHGVLFEAMTPRDWYRGYVDPNNEMDSAVPKALVAESFTIREGKNRSPLKVVLQRMSAVEQLDQFEPHRHYRYLDPTYRACSESNWANRPTPQCNSEKYAVQDAATLNKLLAAGKIQDISEQFNKAEGLFRVGPENGFEVGKTYTISYRDSNAPASDSSTLSAVMTVTIDPPISISAEDKFTLDLNDVPRRRLLPLATGGSCSGEYPMIVQHLEYRVPAAYAPYHDSLFYFTQRQQLYDSNGVELSNQKFQAMSYRSNVCGSIPFGGSELGPGKELTGTMCSNDSRSEPAAQVRGYVGFLEVEDTLHETPAARVNFNSARGNSCDGYSFLLLALESKNIEQIRQSTCAMSQAYLGETNPRQFLPTLLRVANSADPDTRRCAAMALVTEASALKTLDDGTATTVVNTLVKRLSDPDMGIRQTASLGLAQFAGSISERIRERTASPDLNLSIFKPAVPGLAAMLSDPGVTDSSAQQGASGVLTTMGPMAKEAIPILLRGGGTSDYMLPQVLAAIAPKDPRVRAFLLEDARRGQPGSIEVLGGMGAEARYAAPVLFDFAETSQYDYLRQDAMQALVQISNDDSRLIHMITANLTFMSADAMKAEPKVSYLRASAITAFGAMGRRAKAAVPAIMAVLDKAPDQYEYMQVIQTLRAIDVPPDVILQACKKGANSPVPEVRVFAAQTREQLQQGHL